MSNKIKLAIIAKINMNTMSTLRKRNGVITWVKPPNSAWPYRLEFISLS
jgi:hypothetical protein